MINVLQIVKEPSENHRLFNEQFLFDKGRFRVTVCYLVGKNKGCNRLENKIHKIIYLGFSDKKVKWYRPAIVKNVQTIIDQEQIDVVNCHRHRATLIGVAAGCCSQRKPYVFSTVHGFERKSTWQRKVIDFFFYKRLTGLIAVSESVRRHILEKEPRLPADKVHVIHNGSNFEKFLTSGVKDIFRQELFPASRIDEFCFGTAGRLVPVKNHERLIRAFAQVVIKQPKVRLIIAGQGQLSSHLQKLVEHLDIAGHVDFLGFRDDLHQVLKSLDAFVFPSLREGLPMALLEAMATGLPVIAARVGGIPEILQDCPGGFLINPTDVDELAAKMSELIEMASFRREEMGRASKQHALVDFSADRMVSQYEALFARAVTAGASVQ